MTARTIRRRIASTAALLGLAVALAACGGTGSAGGPSAGDGTTGTQPTAQSSDASGGPATDVTSDVTINFWHVYPGSDGDVMNKLIKDFEKQYPHITVNGQFVGSFGDLGKKVVSALQAGAPPDLTIAYPSDVVNYLPSGKLLPLTKYLNDPKVGLDKTSQADIFPIELSINKYASAHGDFMSFPFTANVMIMYYNKALLTKAGIGAPPRTWSEFEQQCAQIKAKLGIACYSANANASTLDGFAGTYGADIMTKDGKPAFGESGWTQMLTMLAGLQKKGYVQLTGSGEVTTPDVSTFVSQGAPFIFSTNRNVPFIQDAVAGGFDWSAAPPPQKERTDKPTTVLYGPGLAAFASGNSQRELASWLLIKYLASPDAQGIWAGETGNLPIRASVADNAAYKARLGKYPATKAAFDLLPDVMFEGSVGEDGVVAVPVPKVRTLLTDAMTSILSPGADAAAVQSTLQQGAIAATGGK